jgi:exodeoxyribonuclease VII large subunit
MDFMKDTVKDAPCPQEIFSVKEISFALKKTVEGTYSGIKVKGEISGLKKHSSGHMYFALKDDEAVLDAVCWRGVASKQDIQPEDGLEIIAQGRLSTYPGRSKYQMIVESFMPTGKGALLKVLEERKTRLREAGYFDTIHKKPLPPFPKRIGIITSPTGAVIQDILHRLEERYPCHVLLWPTLVQGTEAAEQIAKAIVGMNDLPNHDRPDVLIVARGGGSLEDLWAFNEEIVAEATYHSHIPLISAVGHETDTTLIDFVSDKRAPTPTAAAEIATPVLSDVWENIQGLHQRLHRSMVNHLKQGITHYRGLERFIKHPKILIEEKEQRLDEWRERLFSSLKKCVDDKSKAFDGLSIRLRFPLHTLQTYHQQIKMLSQKLEHTCLRNLTSATERMAYLAHRLQQSSYEKTLQKGFCVLLSNDQVPLTSAACVPDNTPMTLTFYDGKVRVVKK